MLLPGALVGDRQLQVGGVDARLGLGPLLNLTDGRRDLGVHGVLHGHRLRVLRGRTLDRAVAALRDLLLLRGQGFPAAGPLATLPSGCQLPNDHGHVR